MPYAHSVLAIFSIFYYTIVMKSNTSDKNSILLDGLVVGDEAIVSVVGGSGELRQHFLDMGLIPGAKIRLVKYAPMGDPIEFRIHGYELTLRKDDAKKIEIRDIQKNAQSETSETEAEKIPENQNVGLEHPGLGEGGRFHEKETENPLPENETLTFALAGNQNCGKTTLFNRLTGSNQHVGNFPGVTVDRKSGAITNYENTLVTDLPGIYSLSPYSNEEIVSRKFILDERPAGIINILDATSLERSLYLSMQLMELEVPMVLALNMMDELTGNGGSVDINKMEQMVGIPVVPISAVKNEGIDELVRHALHVSKYQEKPARTDFCDDEGSGAAIHRCIHAIMHLIYDHAEHYKIPVRFAATKLVEGDKYVIDRLNLSQNEKEMIEHIVLQMEEECHLDRAACIADMRYSFIKKVCAACLKKPKKSAERERSYKIDKVLTNKYLAIPSFIAIMALVFFLTFNVIGSFLQDLMEIGIDNLKNLTDATLTNIHVNSALHSLIIDGIFNGVGSVLSFLPIIVTLFLFLSLLEDTGYMARVAFFMDKILRKIGLSGRSIVPMLIGFGCSVPAVMASRTLPSDRDRKMTIMLTPYMSCSAKLPIYAFFSEAFFPKYAALVMVALYFIGIIVGILVALILNASLFKGEAVPFVMELPNYRMPGAKNVAQLLWEKAKDFLQKAFTIIFIATIVIWFLQSFDAHLNITTDSSTSLLAHISGFIAPIFKPLGFGNWELTSALITGFIAKESVVSTLIVLFGNIEALHAILTLPATVSLLVFCLLYTPCVAAIASIHRELGTKWALSVVIFQCVIAWLCALGCGAVAGLVV